MKVFKKIFLGLFLFLAAAILLLYLFNYEYILRAIQVTYFTGHTTAYIEDYPEFENRKIEAGTTQPWPKHIQYNIAEASPILKELNSELETVAFLIIKNDSIWYEDYNDDYGPDSKSNSFSMAKSIVSALLGKALKEGKIKNLEQPVSDFYPQFDSRLSVGDLASMSSGLNWEENYYSPFSMTARAYFGENIRQQILDLEVTEAPGEEWEYLSGNTQLLGMVIEKATGKHLSAYLSESFWQPMGMENAALWQLDSEESGMEKAYCCIASNARDFARFGKLYKDFGKWNGEQLLDSSFVATSIQPRFEETPHYGYGWWLENYRNKEIFYMRGILGQYVIVIPEDNLIIVRLGRKKMDKTEGSEHSNDFYAYIDEAYRMLEKR
jgi:CubicO group peptidase (beta-lactamase class C family)